MLLMTWIFNPLLLFFFLLNPWRWVSFLNADAGFEFDQSITQADFEIKKILYEVEVQVGMEALRTFSFDLVPSKKEISPYDSFIKFMAHYFIKNRDLPLSMLYQNATNIQILGEHEYLHFVHAQHLRVVEDVRLCDHFRLKELKHLFAQERAYFLSKLGKETRYFLESIRKDWFPIKLLFDKLFPGRDNDGFCNDDLSVFSVFKQSLLQLIQLKKAKVINGFMLGTREDIRICFKFFLNFLVQSKKNILKQSCECRDIYQNQLKWLLFNNFLPELQSKLIEDPENPLFDFDTNKKERIQYLTSLDIRPPMQLQELQSSSTIIIEILEKYIDALLTNDINEYKLLMNTTEVMDNSIKKFLNLLVSKGHVIVVKGEFFLSKVWQSIFKEFLPIFKKVRIHKYDPKF